MFNPAWLFVIASIIAVFGILFAFKKLMAYVQTMIENDKVIDTAELQKAQTGFFIQVAMTEAVPIILIVYGFMQIEQLKESYSILVPLLIIAIAVLVALVNIIVLRRDILGYEGTPAETKNLVNTLIFIGFAMICAIPIISFVAMFTMNV